MRGVLGDGPLSHLPSNVDFCKASRTRFLVFDDIPHHISACLVCMFLPLLYPSQRYPLFYLCTLYCCLYFLFLLICSFVFFHMARCSLLSLSLSLPLCLACLLSSVCHFRDTGSLVDFGRNSHHLTSTISHLRESSPGKDQITSLISFRGWFTGVTHVSLTHHSGISSHGMVGKLQGFVPRAYFRIRLAIWRLNREAPYLFYLVCFFFLLLSLGEHCRSFEDFYLLLRVLDVAHAFYRSFDSLFLSCPFISSCR